MIFIIERFANYYTLCQRNINVISKDYDKRLLKFKDYYRFIIYNRSYRKTTEVLRSYSRNKNLFDHLFINTIFDLRA